MRVSLMPLVLGMYATILDVKLNMFPLCIIVGLIAILYDSLNGKVKNDG